MTTAKEQHEQLKAEVRKILPHLETYTILLSEKQIADRSPSLKWIVDELTASQGRLARLSGWNG